MQMVLYCKHLKGLHLFHFLTGLNKPTGLERVGASVKDAQMYQKYVVCSYSILYHDLYHKAIGIAFKYFVGS